MDYINLENEDNLLDIPTTRYETTKKDQNIPSLDLPEIDYKQNKNPLEDDHLLGVVCGDEQFYGDESKEGYFVKENLFSELVDEYQRAIARLNLGIGEEYAMIWGNIKGDISNQRDLQEYLTTLLRDYINEYVKRMNEVLSEWSNEIDNKISQKLDKFSPHLEGIPTTTLPDIEDDSNRIASTEWVKALLGEDEGRLLKHAYLDKNFIFADELPKDVYVRWEFYELPDELIVAGQNISINRTDYLVGKLFEDTFVKISYRFGNKWYNKILTFNKINAYYIGTASDIHLMTKSEKSEWIIDSSENDFVYLHIPNDSQARLSVDNIYGGFKVVDNFLLGGIHYYSYRTVNQGLGKLHISYDKQ